MEDDDLVYSTVPNIHFVVVCFTSQSLLVQVVEFWDYDFRSREYIQIQGLHFVVLSYCIVCVDMREKIQVLFLKFFRFKCRIYDDANRDFFFFLHQVLYGKVYGLCQCLV